MSCEKLDPMSGTPHTYTDLNADTVTSQGKLNEPHTEDILEDSLEPLSWSDFFHQFYNSVLTFLHSLYQQILSYIQPPLPPQPSNFQAFTPLPPQPPHFQAVTPLFSNRQKALSNMASSSYNTLHKLISPTPPTQKDLSIQQLWKATYFELCCQHQMPSSIKKFLEKNQSAEKIRLFFTNSNYEQYVAKISSLNLSHLSLTEIPPEIKYFIGLEKLYIHSNQLTTLPEEINSLKKLTVLDASDNKITSIHKNALKLPKLTHLNLARNQLSSIPALTDSQDLEHLTLSENAFTEIHDNYEIDDSFWWVHQDVTPKLQAIEFDNNPISDYPLTIGNFTGLVICGKHTGLYHLQKK